MPSKSEEHRRIKRIKNNKRKKSKSEEYTERKRLKKNHRNRQRADTRVNRQRCRTDTRVDRDRVDTRVDRDRVDTRVKRERIDYYREYNSNTVASYEEAILEGPTEICISCGGLFFPKHINLFSREDLLTDIGEEMLATICQVLNDSVDVLQLCNTCTKAVLEGKVPKLCLANGLKFRDIPEELAGLSQLEERLVAPRIPFMQIRELGVDKQFGIRGSIANVPIEIDKSVDCLPRTMDRTETVELKLKRMRSHKTNYSIAEVRPFAVMRAAEYLVRQPLYIAEGVKLSTNWEQYLAQAIKDSQDDCENTIEGKSISHNYLYILHILHTQSVG